MFCVRKTQVYKFMSETIIIIPSRMAAKRLPGKPLLKLNNKTIITNVFKRAEKANLGKVYVATEDHAIYEEVKKNHGNCIMTQKGHKSGSDRIFEAISNLNLEKIKYVINLQGDEPLINPEDIKKLNSYVTLNNLDLGTLAANIDSDKKLNDNNIVKVKTLKNLKQNEFSQALDFNRSFSKSEINIYHHIGIYQYKIETLKKFVNLKQSKKEKILKLEQMRALENNIKIQVKLIDEVPIGVDTMQDYIDIKKIMSYKS